MVGYFANTGNSSFWLTMTNCSFSTTNNITSTGDITFGGLLGEMATAGSALVRPTNCTVNITATFMINSASAHDFYVGALVGKDNGSAADVIIGGSGTTYTGNTTSGTITTTYASTAGTKYIGNAANKYVCGVTKVMPPNNQDASTLNLTIN